MTAFAPASGIRVEHVSKRFSRRVLALDDVSFDIHSGEAFGIIGPNGAGKTTLFGCLLGLLNTDAGRVTVAGVAPDDLRVRAMTGYVPERLVFDPTLTPRQVLELRHQLLSLPRLARGADIEAMLERVALPADARTRTLRTFSRGMLQRVGLAHALLGSPRYLFLDEPTLGIDPVGSVQLRELLNSLKAIGTTVVINSHDLAHLERVCDRVALINAGKLERVESLRAAVSAKRVLRVGWSMSTPAPTTIALKACAQRAKVTLTHSEVHHAHFTVDDEAQVTALIKALLESDVHVTEVTPEEARLERFFEAARA